MNPPKFEDRFPEAAEALKEIYASDFMPFFDANGERSHFPLWFTTKKFETQEGLAFAIIKAYMQRKFHGIGRNDPCPCASGKKYKHCCLNIK